ncbi:MAG: EAL domain-containing protein [Chromatiales bacterium]|jgi:diguanylate cyclase (GGDEF)-like protein/PAS domain S-box-containing protein
MSSDSNTRRQRDESLYADGREGRQLRCKQVEMLYDQARIGIASSIAAGLFLVAVFWPITPHSILFMWFALVCLGAGLRLILIHQYEHAAEIQAKTGYWLGWFVLGAAVSGITWGVVTIVLVPDRSIAQISFALLWIGGLSAGTAAAYAVVRRAFLSFSWPAMLPTAIYLFSIGGRVEVTIGIGTLLFIGFLTLSALRMHNILLRELELRLENTRLIAHLEKEKARVDRINDLLERRVAERTAELTQTNRSLQQEIAERKRTDEALSQAAAVFENTSEGAMITDNAQGVVAVNRAFTEITGYTQQEIIGRSSRLLYANEQNNALFAEMASSLNQTGHWRGEIRQRRKNGEFFPIWLNVSAVTDADDRVTHNVSLFSDITSLKESQEQLERLAHHDVLTGLPNRLLFHARLEHALERARREGNKVAILCLDLDHFKNINDSLGHPAGDRLLQVVTQRLLHAVREEDTVARFGGDEFSLLLEDLRDSKDAGIVAEKVLKVLAKPFDLDGHESYVSGSIGISLFPDDGQDITTLLKNADSALYQAKEQGRNTYHFYTKDLTRAAFKRLGLESSLRRAVERDEFILFYQPQVDLSDGRVVGAEALLRWRHPELGLMLPNEFIPMTESTGLIVKLGEWVLHTACTQAKAWQNAGLPFIRMAVNLSSVQVSRGDMLHTMKRVLGETGLDPRYMELEITEGLIMQQTQQTIRTLDELTAMGVMLAIDDFGTGYSSLSYLRRLPLQRLKIDKSFVREIPDDAGDRAITRAVIALGNNLNLTVVAEGVENEVQREFLFNNGCDEAQGYLYGAPLPAVDFATLVQREGKLVQP